MVLFDTQNHGGTSGVRSVVARATLSGVDFVRRWHDRRTTRKALMTLSARELDDIGLSAADIDTIVRRG